MADQDATTEASKENAAQPALKAPSLGLKRRAFNAPAFVKKPALAAPGSSKPAAPRPAASAAAASHAAVVAAAGPSTAAVADSEARYFTVSAAG